MLLSGLSGEFVATTKTTALQDLTAGFGSHALTEAMFSGTF